jgi:hypothetical protein
MKNVKVILALCLSGFFANAQLSNGGFESFVTLPTCPSSYDITKASSWNGLRTTYSGANCNNSIVDVLGAPSNVDYFNQSAGGTSSCQNGTPRTGNGYVVCEERGFVGNSPFNELIFQSLSVSLSAGTQYQFRCYVNRFTSTASLAYFNVYLVNQSVGSTASAIMNAVRSQSGLVGPLSGIPAGTGWKVFEKKLTVPSTGNYYLVIGDMFFCNDFNSSTLFRWGIDDVEFGVACANAGPNKNNSRAGGCCGPCNPSSVQIGTPAQAGYSYSWLPTTALSNAAIAQPNASPCNSTIYSLTASGPNCVTSTSTVYVIPIPGPSCCKLSAVTGIKEEAEEKEAFFYPNPASGLVNISLLNLPQEIKIMDLNGKTVFIDNKISTLNYSIDISKFSKGLYFLNIKTDQKTESHKLIIN